MAPNEFSRRRHRKKDDDGDASDEPPSPSHSPERLKRTDEDDQDVYREGRDEGRRQCIRCSPAPQPGMGGAMYDEPANERSLKAVHQLLGTPAPDPTPRTWTVKPSRASSSTKALFGPTWTALYSSIAAIEALISVATKPASSARPPSRARSPRRAGAMPPIPPSWIPIDAKFAKPVSAKVASE